MKAREAKARAKFEAMLDSPGQLSARQLIILQHMSVCAPGPIPLDFLKQFYKIRDIKEHLNHLRASGWCVKTLWPLTKSYTLHPTARQLIRQRYNTPFASKFLLRVNTAFRRSKIPTHRKNTFMPQLEEAVALAQQLQSRHLQFWVPYLHDFCMANRHHDFYLRLCDAAALAFPSHKPTLAAAYGRKAQVLYHRGQLEEALDLSQQAAQFDKETQNPTGEAASLAIQALILMRMKKLDQAQALLEQAIDRYTVIRDGEGVATVLWHLGILHGKKGDFPQKKSLWKQAITIRKNFRLPHRRHQLTYASIHLNPFKTQKGK